MINKAAYWGWLAALCSVLAGCATVPETIVQVPMTARPVVAAQAKPANGGIFQASAYRPLFEDRRPRIVGDLVTVSINEKTSAGKQAASSASKSGSASLGVPKLFGIPSGTLADLGVSANGGNKFDSKGALTSSNTFSGTIGATVVEVLSNGNLVIAGEKQIALDEGSEYIRFSGIVNPDSILAGNIVSSTQIADAKVEYRTNTRLDSAAVLSMMSRFFMSVIPL